METLELLKALTEAHGPSGQEQAVCELVQAYWSPWVDELHVDAMGNLIGLQCGTAPEPRPSLMLAAHMDEIALVVTKLEGEFLRVHDLRGMDRRVLLGLRVIVHGKKDLPGVIGTRPPHVLPPEERRQVVPWDQVFVDVGLSAEDLKSYVRVGDFVTVQQALAELKNGLVAGKALDNRISVAAVTLALESLRKRDHAWDVYAVATVQEEMGIKGAVTSAYGVAPDMAVALDVTFAKQYDDSGVEVFEINKGPTVGVGPNFHPQVVARLKSIAKEEEIPYQLEALPGSSGTDAWGIQVAREGIPCGLLSIPVRYMHQPVETGSLRDLERAARWVTRFVASLDADFRPHWEDEV